MGSVETIHLRWNQYEANMKYGFAELRYDGDFYDVTLVCGDNQVKAHKVILGTCSSFFKSLLKSISHQHPCLYLRGIEFNHLQSILSFMYNGEVCIQSHELENFLAVAQELKVRGLMIDQAPSSPNESPEKSQHFKDEAQKGGVKRESSAILHASKKSRISTDKKRDSVKEDSPQEESNSDTQFDYANAPDVVGVECETEEEYSAIEDQNRNDDIEALLDARLSEFVSQRDANKKFRCLKCSYSSSRHRNVLCHIEARHFKTDGFPCVKCGRKYKTRDSRKSHYRTAHKYEVEYFSTDNV